MSYHILIVEDEPAVAKGLTFGLREEGYTVSQAGTTAEAESQIVVHPPHLALLDVRLPDGNGFDLCRKFRSMGLTFPIIMVTARDEVVDKVIGLEIGADDYIVKPFSFRELLSRVRAQIRRAYGALAASEESASIRFGDFVADFRELSAKKDGEDVFLTPTEFRLLRHFSENENSVLSREQLIAAVWGPSTFLADERTVDVHIRHLREKIETDPSSPRHLLTVRGYGYKFVPNS